MTLSNFESVIFSFYKKTETTSLRSVSVGWHFLLELAYEALFDAGHDGVGITEFAAL